MEQRSEPEAGTGEKHGHQRPYFFCFQSTACLFFDSINGVPGTSFVDATRGVGAGRIVPCYVVTSGWGEQELDLYAATMETLTVGDGSTVLYTSMIRTRNQFQTLLHHVVADPNPNPDFVSAPLQASSPPADRDPFFVPVLVPP